MLRFSDERGKARGERGVRVMRDVGRARAIYPLDRFIRSLNNLGQIHKMILIFYEIRSR